MDFLRHPQHPLPLLRLLPAGLSHCSEITAAKIRPLALSPVFMVIGRRNGTQLTLLFKLYRAAHVFDGFERRLVFVKHLEHRVGDGHVNAGFCANSCALSVVGHHTHFALYLMQRHALPQLEPHGTIARQVTRGR